MITNFQNIFSVIFYYLRITKKELQKINFKKKLQKNVFTFFFHLFIQMPFFVT